MTPNVDKVPQWGKLCKRAAQRRAEIEEDEREMAEELERRRAEMEREIEREKEVEREKEKEMEREKEEVSVEFDLNGKGANVFRRNCARPLLPRRMKRSRICSRTWLPFERLSGLNEPRQWCQHHVLSSSASSLEFR